MYSLDSLSWTNSFAALPEDFYSRVKPSPFKNAPRMIHFNDSAAELIGLKASSDANPDNAVAMAKDVLAQYQTLYTQQYAELMWSKLGLVDALPEDQQLLQDLLDLMQHNQVDYTIFFRSLACFKTNYSKHHLRDLFVDRDAFDAWSSRYTERLLKEKSNDAERQTRMNRVNPKFVLRNYLAEVAICKAEDEQDYSEIEKLFAMLQHPFDEWPEYEDYANHPQEWAQQISVSCSS